MGRRAPPPAAVDRVDRSRRRRHLRLPDPGRVMTVAVLVPWRPGCPHRERAWAKVQELYADRHPDWALVTGSCAEGPFNRSQGILDAARRTDAELLVVADADVWCDPG